MEFAFYRPRHAGMLDPQPARRGTTRGKSPRGGMGKALIKLFHGHALLEYMPGQRVKVTFSASTACTTAACTAN